MFEILSDQQKQWWTEGKIENLRYDPPTQMLTYRLCIDEDPRPVISFRVPDERAAKYRGDRGKSLFKQRPL